MPTPNALHSKFGNAALRTMLPCPRTHIRSGQLVPGLAQHMSDHLGVHLYYGSRTAQPKRVRAFIDLAVKRLANAPACVLSAKELTSEAASLRKGAARKSLTVSGEKVRPKRTRR